MKLIKADYSIIEQSPGLQGIYKIIEQAGRVCYKSEDKITETSAKNFVERMIKSDHCYTGEVEVLTEKGWIKFRDYNGEKVAAINKDCSFKGFEYPNRVVNYSYRGSFYYYPSLGIEVTDGHNMFGVFRESKNNFYTNSSYTLFSCNTLYKDNNGREKTLGERMFKTPRHCSKPIFLNPYGELIGFWLGDGCYSPETKNKLVFHLKKERKIEYLKMLCAELGYIFEKRKSNYYTVTNDNIGSSFTSLFYNNGKRIPLQYFPSIDIAYSIIHGLINSDGSLGINTKTITFTNTSKSIIDWMLMYAPLCGYTISDRGICHISSNHNPVYKVLLLDTDYTLNNDLRNKDSRVIITSGTKEVYCVTVSTGLIMVRGASGITTICGNCAMLEHGTVYLAIPMTTYAPEAVNSYMDTPYAKVNQCNEFIFTDRYGDKVSAWCVTTNYRFLIEHDILEDLEFICEPTKYHEKRITVRFNTNIGISREFNRHRVNSIAEQSTRYCNYGKNKFGGVGINLPSWVDFEIQRLEDITENVLPTFEQLKEEYFSVSDQGITKDDWGDIEWWLWSNLVAEESYLKLIEIGRKPQEARVVLPLDTNTELIHTAFISDWEHFFKLRDDKQHAHPDAYNIAHPLHEEFIEKGYIK